MSIDRGGLRYEIEVVDAFSANLKQFVAGLEEGRKAWTDFKADLGKNQSISRDLAASQKALSDALKQQVKTLADVTAAGAKATKAKADLLKAETELQKQQNKRQELDRAQAARDAKAASTAAKKAKLLSIEEEAAKKAAKAIRNLAVEEAKLEILRKQGINLQVQRINLIKAEEQAAARLAAAKKKSAVDELVFQGLGGVKGEAQRRLQAEERRKQIDQEIDRLRNASSRASRSPEEQRLRDELAARIKQIRDLQAKLNQRETKAPADEVKNLRDRIKDLREEFGRADGGGNKLLFTFRRLFGVLALFQAARGLLNLLKNAVAEVFKFNSATQDAILGIQALIAASGTLANSQGQIVTGAEKFALANKEARKQVELLRKEGLKTSATFNDLLQAYQSALAPGLRAGFSPDQVRGFAIRIAQAAASIGLPQNQLSEEIRSILAGTIQQRTTRIAASLGITNEDIRRAKEAGTLVQFLFDKFDAFSIAGEQALGNFSNILAKLKDTIAILIGTAGGELFKEVSDAAKELLDSILIVGKQGVGIDSNAVALARTFFSVVQAIFRQAREIARQFTLKDGLAAIKELSKSLINLINLAGTFVKAFVPGFLNGFSLMKQIVNLAGELIKTLSGGTILPNEAARVFIRYLGAGVGLVLGLKAALTIVGAIFGIMKLAVIPITAAFKIWTTSAKVLAVVFNASTLEVRLILLGILAVLAAITLIVLALKNDFVRQITIGGVKIGVIADLLKFGILNAINKLGTAFEAVWDNTVTFARRALLKVKGFIAELALTPTELILTALNKIGVVSDETLKDFQERHKKFKDELEKANKELEDGLKKRGEERDEEKDARERELLKRFLQSANDLAATPGKTFGEAFNELKDQVLGFKEDTAEAASNLDTAEQSAKTLLDIFSQTPAILGQTISKLEDMGDILQGLKDKLKDAQDDLVGAQLTLGLEGVSKNIFDVYHASALFVRENTREFEIQRAQIEAALKEIEVREAGLQLSLEKTARIPASALGELKEIAREVARLEDERLLTLQGIQTVEREISQKEKSNQTEEVSKLRQRLDLLKRENEQRALVQASLAEQGERVVDSLGLEADAREKVLEIIRDLTVAEGQRALNQTLLADNAKETGRVQTFVNETQIEQIAKILLLEKERLRLANNRARAELDGARFVSNVRQATSGISGDLPGTQNESLRRLASVRSELLIQTEKTAELQKQAALDVKGLKLIADKAKGTKAEQAAQETLNGKIREYQNLLEQATLEIQDNVREVERLQAILEEPFELGFQSALEEFSANAQDIFRITYDIGRETIEGLSRFISDSIVDALDPTKKLDLYARFTEFMNGVTRIIIESLVKLAIAKAILAPLGLGGSSQTDALVAEAAAIKATTAATLAGAAAAEAAAAAAAAAASAAQAAAVSAAGSIGGIGFNTGGLVPQRSSTPSWAHRNAKGYAGGGRPAGVPASDTIAAWLTPREFVQPVAAVDTYGLDIMERLRRRLIDPLALRAIAGMSKVRAVNSISSSRRIAYASGGGVTNRGFESVANQSLTIINVMDKNELYNAMADRNGEQVLVNVINANRTKVTI